MYTMLFGKFWTDFHKILNTALWSSLVRKFFVLDDFLKFFVPKDVHFIWKHSIIWCMEPCFSKNSGRASVKNMGYLSLLLWFSVWPTIWMMLRVKKSQFWVKIYFSKMLILSQSPNGFGFKLVQIIMLYHNQARESFQTWTFLNFKNCRSLGKLTFFRICKSFGLQECFYGQSL